jgi:SAM-dependent methyltransferase
MRHRPSGTASTVDRDGPSLEEPSPRAGAFSRPRVNPGQRIDLKGLPPAEVVAAQLAPREPVPPLDLVTIRQWLWGRGFYLPGDLRHVLQLVQPLALMPSMTLLDVAAGLGGAARAIAQEYGVSVTAIERDEELARRSAAIAAGMAKPAAVKVFDPEGFELRVGTFDRVLAREATYMVDDKERFLRVLSLGLRPEGRLLMTDFVVEPSLAERPALDAWSALQPRRPRLWGLRQYSDCLRGLGLDLRLPEDMTLAYKAQIISGWDNLLQTVDLRSLPRDHRSVVLAEAERWMNTISAFDAGILKVYRFTALTRHRGLALSQP